MGNSVRNILGVGEIGSEKGFDRRVTSSVLQVPDDVLDFF